jgi:hypothetical protein
MTARARVKKIVVSPGIANLSPDEKCAHARKVKNTCEANSAYKQSQPCQDAMAVWMTKTDALEKNQQAKATLLTQLKSIFDQEGTLVFEFDLAAAGFVTAVKNLAGNDPTIVTALGLALRADPTRVLDPFTPTGLKFSLTKGKRLPKLEWDPMPGAVLYVAQVSVVPASDATWQIVYGSGKSRMLPALSPGQHYTGRVAAVGKDGKQSAWSAEVQFTG